MRGGLSHDGTLYAAPFYGESSMVMYRTDLMEKAGLDMALFKTDMADPALTLQIQDTMSLANRIPALTGTPFFMINDEYFAGANVDYLQALLEQGEQISQMMKVTGEEGVTLADYVTFQKALFIDMIMSSNGIIVPPPRYLEEVFARVRSAGGPRTARRRRPGLVSPTNAGLRFL